MRALQSPGNTAYDPVELSVKKGENVTVVNNDNAPMTATSGNSPEDAGQAFDTSLIMPGRHLGQYTHQL